MEPVAAGSPLFYEHEDPGDHQDGGACIRVFRDETQVDRLERYADEYRLALVALFVAGEGHASGWQFAAPAIFLAHHACELALKVRWLRCSAAPPVGFRIHDLRALVSRVEGAGGLAELDLDERAKLDRRVEQLRHVTSNGISIRYAEIDERWCCLNLGSLIDLVDEVQAILRQADG